ncbi:MAG: ABC transporter permease [Acidimicrobiales bacterium]|nr:ABC transporter permease [Acidimicrobiales bacterium]
MTDLADPPITAEPRDELRERADALKRSKRKKRRKAMAVQTVLSALTFGALALIWEVMSALDPSFWPEIILSKPTEIAPAFWEAVQTGFVWENFYVTFQATVIGFAIGAVSGLLLGLFIRPGAVVLPGLLSGGHPVPVDARIALAPVFIAWFGFGMSSKIALAATICFFPVLVNTITGLNQVGENAILLMKSMQASRWQIFFHLRIFVALPTIFAGLKAALTFALIGVIVGELKATDEGAGHLIEVASFQLRMDDVFAYLGLLSLFGLALYLLANAVERKVVYWQPGSDGEHA